MMLRVLFKAAAASKQDIVAESKLKKLACQSDDFQKTLDYLLRRDILAAAENRYRFRAGLLCRGVTKQR